MEANLLLCYYTNTSNLLGINLKGFIHWRFKTIYLQHSARTLDLFWLHHIIINIIIREASSKIFAKCLLIDVLFGFCLVLFACFFISFCVRFIFCLEYPVFGLWKHRKLWSAGQSKTWDMQNLQVFCRIKFNWSTITASYSSMLPQV